MYVPKKTSLAFSDCLFVCLVFNWIYYWIFSIKLNFFSGSCYYKANTLEKIQDTIAPIPTSYTNTVNFGPHRIEIKRNFKSTHKDKFLFINLYLSEALGSKYVSPHTQTLLLSESSIRTVPCVCMCKYKGCFIHSPL